VFDGSGDDVPSNFAGAHNPKDGVIVGFRATAGEHDFLGPGSDQRGHFFHAPFQTAARDFWPNVWMDAALPNSVEKKGSMASSTSGSTGVVALKSR